MEIPTKTLEYLTQHLEDAEREVKSYKLAFRHWQLIAILLLEEKGGKKLVEKEFKKALEKMIYI